MEQIKTNAPLIQQTDANIIVKNVIERKIQRPIMFLGKGGIGKTESIEKITKELEIGYVDVRLLLYTESDLKGVPYVNDDHSATIWLQNDILPREDRDGKTGILVFDEITSCAKSVRTAAYQLLNERKLGEYELPEDWYMICLGNGENDGGQFNGMEANFANRCSVYEIEPSASSWKSWALKNDINPLVIGYVSWKPEDMHTMNAEIEEEIVFASPRSWKAVSDILNKTEFDKNNRILSFEIRANIGETIGRQFFAYCEFKEQAVEPTAILAGTEKKHPEGIEVTMVTIQSLIKLMADTIKESIADGKTVDDISKDKDITSKCSNGIKWILGLGKLEFQTMAIKDFIGIDKDVMVAIILNPNFLKNCKELLEFTEANEMIFTDL